MQTITPFLWFDTQAEEAMNFYLSIFKDGKILSTMPGPNNTVLGVEFEILGQRFQAINAGPEYKFSEAVSFFVSVETQEEVDHYWEKLTADGGTPGQCGWLKDKFGLSWQIIPITLGKLMSDPNREKAGRVMRAMMHMSKIEISKLEEAYNAQ